MTAAVSGAAFLLRLPSMVQPVGIDQGIFLTAGWGMTRGLALYRDVWDQKPPGIHLTYALAVAFAGSHSAVVFWLDFVAALATCAFVYAIARRTGSLVAARVATVAYAALMFPAARYGYGGFLERAVPECFIALFVAGAAFLITRTAAPDTLRLAAAAGLIGCAAVYKPTAVVYFPAFCVWLRTAHAVNWTSVGLAGTALLVPGSLVAAWLADAGTLSDAWIAVVEYNRAYVAIGSGPLALLDRLAHEGWRLIKTDPLWMLGAVAVAVAVADMFRGGVPYAALLGVCWLAAAVIAAAANGIRLYSTYFIPAGVPLALLTGWLFSRIAENRNPRRRMAAAGAIISVACAVALRSHYPARVWTTLVADIEAHGATGDRRLEYLQRFGGYQTGRGYSARANAELATYLVQHTTPHQRVYIFGMAPSVYFLAQRLPANRFIWTYPGVVNLVHRDAFSRETLAADLALSDAAYLVLERNNRDSLTGWKIENEFDSAGVQRILANYVREDDIEDFMLYRRKPRHDPLAESPPRDERK